MGRPSAAALAAAALAASLGGCASMHGAMHAGASTTLSPTQGNATAGTVRLEQHHHRLMVHAQISGLKPNAEHGFHVHEKGDCSSADGMSAGGHFNPGGKPHGHFGGSDRHAGDLPNLRADASGVAEMRVPVSGLTVGGGATDVVGRSIVVHAGPDDYTSQPAGNSGARIACGVIARS
ncbi:MAG: hypothetical protein RIS35_3733 [Pseudomonadota bacterium]|jgi:Cu-Zn family superoxide dismutase